MSNSTWQFQTDQLLVENHGLKLDEFKKYIINENKVNKDELMNIDILNI